MGFIIFVIIAIAVIALLYYIASLLPSQSETRGLRGERKAFSILKELPDEYYIWNDIVLQYTGCQERFCVKTAQKKDFSPKI